MGEHGHDHAAHEHGAGGHTHSVSVDADGRYLTIALLLIVGFMAFEVVVGIVAHSLALLSDAAHMLTDAGALALSLVVLRNDVSAMSPITRVAHNWRGYTGNGVSGGTTLGFLTQFRVFPGTT